MKYGLSPIVNNNCKILILGSLPGEASLMAKQYYAHPKNQFWQIISAVLNEELPNNYDDKCNMLLRHKIALWDVIHYAEREGSLDSNIRNAVPNNFTEFFNQYPNIRAIVLNGNESEKQYKRHFGHIQIPFFKVRSSSPIPSKSINTFEEKTLNWKLVFDKLM